MFGGCDGGDGLLEWGEMVGVVFGYVWGYGDVGGYVVGGDGVYVDVFWFVYEGGGFGDFDDVVFVGCVGVV